MEPLVAEAGPSLYGGYDLRRGDRDALFRYGGAVRGGSEPLPRPGEVPFVTQLQRDLRELGFLLVGEPSGDFGLETEWAIREFQIYARMARLARERPQSSARYLDRLEAVSGPTPYAGPISGVVNFETRLALDNWRQGRLRCPVVLEAWRMANGRRSRLEGQNIWLRSDLSSSAPRVFARDFSGYFETLGALPPTDSEGMVALGEFGPYLSWGGPQSIAGRHSWPSGEVLPEALTGLALPALRQSPRSLSTFKVVRTVSELECGGFFDSLTAYDRAFISMGPCHWALGLADRPGGNVTNGELCAFLAYFRDRHPGEAASFLDRFGITPSARWAAGSDGRPLFDPSQRKYTAWLSRQAEDGQFLPFPRTVPEAEYLRTWHWFYRFVMATRSIAPLRQRMWDMARIRLRDVLSAPWGAGVAPVPRPGGGTRPATIGDLYSSEAAVAAIYRWHILAPAHVLSGGQAAATLRDAFTRAQVPANPGPPTTWSRNVQDRLVEGLLTKARQLASLKLEQHFQHCLDWPDAWGSNPRRYQLPRDIGRLSREPRSFQLDDGGLPPAPF